LFGSLKARGVRARYRPYGTGLLLWGFVKCLDLVAALSCAWDNPGRRPDSWSR
jgi:hypothetical protein